MRISVKSADLIADHVQSLEGERVVSMNYTACASSQRPLALSPRDDGTFPSPNLSKGGGLPCRPGTKSWLGRCGLPEAPILSRCPTRAAHRASPAAGLCDGTLESISVTSSSLFLLPFFFLSFPFLTFFFFEIRSCVAQAGLDLLCTQG